MEEQKNNEPKAKVDGVQNKDVEENKAIAILSYIGVLCFVPLLAKKESDFAQFHAKQGLTIFIGEVVGMVLSSMIFFAPFGILINLAALVVSIIGIVNVLDGNKKKIPVIGDLTEKMNL